MIDYLIPKPTTVRGYALHRMAEGLTGGSRPLFTDCGDHLVVRTDRKLDAPQRPLREVNRGDIVGFELRACVGKKIKGRHVYFHTSDWRSRHEWLSRQGQRHGFEVITVYCAADIATVTKGERQFTLDQTDFTGVLTVVDEALFRQAMVTGIGSKGRAFGFGMINI
jgi:hypothetical protein